MEGEDYMNGPRVIKAGKDPDCIHSEYINTSMIGTCRSCGRVRKYARTLAGDVDPAKNPVMRAAMLEEFQQTQAASQEKAPPKRQYTRRGTSNPESAQWSRLKRSSR